MSTGCEAAQNDWQLHKGKAVSVGHNSVLVHNCCFLWLRTLLSALWAP